MGFTNDYPYTDFHEMNLDWLISKMKSLDKSMTEFKALNSISYGGVWDITKQYQAWTVVVTDDEGYISIQAVPAGIDISNTDYWITIGDLPARVLALESEMDTAQSQIALLEAGKIQQRIIVIGDSYLYGLEVGGTVLSTNWGTLLRDKLGLVENDSFFRVAIDGGGFVSSGGSYVWLTNLQAMEDAITDHDTISHIIVFGGQNDKNKTGVESAISDFCSYCTSEYPNAKIMIGACGVDHVNLTTQQYGLAMIATYKTCTRYGASYIDNSEYLLRDTRLLQSDYCHPNLNGEEVLAAFLYNALNGFTPVNNEQVAQPFTLDGDFASGLLNVLSTQCEGVTCANIYQGLGFTGGTKSITCDGTGYVQLGTIADGPIWGFFFDSNYYQNTGAYTIVDGVVSVGGTLYNCNVLISICAKTVFAFPMIYDSQYITGTVSVMILNSPGSISGSALLI